METASATANNYREPRVAIPIWYCQLPDLRRSMDFCRAGSLSSVITLKPANGDQVKTGQRERPGQDCFTPPIPLAASLFLCANCGDRI